MKRIEVFRIIGSVIWVIIVAIPANAQVKMTEGNVDALKSQKRVNIEFTYDNLSVGKVKNGDIKDKKTEADYVAEIVAEKSKKDTGKGSEWAKAWVDDRKKIFEPHFIKFFQKASDMEAGSFNDAKYTIIYKTNFLDPGVANGTVFGSRTATVLADIWIVETANKSKIIAKLTQNSSGVANSLFDTGQRIGDAYFGAGKSLGKFIKKN